MCICTPYTNVHWFTSVNGKERETKQNWFEISQKWGRISEGLRRMGVRTLSWFLLPYEEDFPSTDVFLEQSGVTTKTEHSLKREFYLRRIQTNGERLDIYFFRKWQTKILRKSKDSNLIKRITLSEKRLISRVRDSGLNVNKLSKTTVLNLSQD